MLLVLGKLFYFSAKTPECLVSTHGQPEWFRDHYRIDFDFLLELFEFMLENLGFMLENRVFSTWKAKFNINDDSCRPSTYSRPAWVT